MSAEANTTEVSRKATMDLSQIRDAEIDSCLAYEVLRHPEEWIGDPAPQSLEAFLGKERSLVTVIVNSDLPGFEEVHGVLEDPDF